MQKNGDVIRLAPGAPKKLDEVRVGQLVLDGDVILPADGATVTERRRIGYGGLITVALPVGTMGGSPEARSCVPLVFPLRRTATISSPTQPMPRPAHSVRATRIKCARSVRLAVRRCATLWTGKKPLVEVMLLQVAAA